MTARISMGITIFFLISATTFFTEISSHPNDINNYQNEKYGGHRQSESDSDDPGLPLFVTPLIEAGRLDEAKNLSHVGPLSGAEDVESYSGLLTVNPDYNSSMFFWYFLAKNNPRTAPVLLWLQGGPGSSDMFSIFFETGPFFIDVDLKLQPRQYAWNTNFNMLYIDNPVGTGFSFTDSDEGYSRSETMVAQNLYEALVQFFTLFHEYSGNDFYLSGESYAGKYVPSIAYEIFVRNPTARKKINLKGMSIGNGLIEPETMNNYGDYLYQLGLIDEQIRLVYKENQDELVSLVKEGKLKEAFYIFDYLINGDFSPMSLFYNATGMHNYFNFLYTLTNMDESKISKFFRVPGVRKAIHVGNLTYSDGQKVESFFLEDFMNTTKPLVATLLDNGYKTMLYNGQLDLIVPFVLTENMVSTMHWKDEDEFRSAERLIWKVAPNDSEVAGYAKQIANFSLVLVRNAGHMTPHDQPRASFDMISRFVAGKPFA